MKKRMSVEAIRQFVVDKPWVMAYNSVRVYYSQTQNLVLMIESYGPPEGFFIEGWRVFHFPRTSSLVKKAVREGGQSIFWIRPGQVELNLVPAFAPIGIESCSVSDSEISITYAGFGGGGVSAAYSRALAKGATGVEILSEGGGKKLGKATVFFPRREFLAVAVDDTDNEVAGATYALMHNLSLELTKTLGVEYLTHGNVQLFPGNPDKTRNCFSTVIGFGISPGQQQEVISFFQKRLAEETLSPNTAMAVMNLIRVPKVLRDYSKKAKSSYIKDLSEVYAVAKKAGVQTYPITGERGLIGAVAALGLYDKPDYASSLLPQHRGGHV